MVEWTARWPCRLFLHCCPWSVSYDWWSLQSNRPEIIEPSSDGKQGAVSWERDQPQNINRSPPLSVDLRFPRRLYIVIYICTVSQNIIIEYFLTLLLGRNFIDNCHWLVSWLQELMLIVLSFMSQVAVTLCLCVCWRRRVQALRYQHTWPGFPSHSLAPAPTVLTEQ